MELDGFASAGSSLCNLAMPFLFQEELYLLLRLFCMFQEIVLIFKIQDKIGNQQLGYLVRGCQ